jgi:hypothetical protein
MSRLGVLPAGSPSSMETRVEAFRQGLRELGYVEGKTLCLSTDMARARENNTVIC